MRSRSLIEQERATLIQQRDRLLALSIRMEELDVPPWAPASEALSMEFHKLSEKIVERSNELTKIDLIEERQSRIDELALLRRSPKSHLRSIQDKISRRTNYIAQLTRRIEILGG